MTGRLRPLEACALAIATLFGAGRSPVAPGTAGTLAAVPLVYLAGRLLPEWGFAAATVALALVGVWAADRAACVLARKDPGAVVIDEAAGFFVTLLFLPVGAFTLGAGFLLFRALDILKPPPARRAERLRGGWGIVADDLVAGFYANLALRLAQAVYARFAA